MCSFISLIYSPGWRGDQRKECKPKPRSVHRCRIDTNGPPAFWLCGRTSGNRSCGHQAQSKDVATFNLGHGCCLCWRILNHKVVKPVRDPGSVDLLAFGSVIDIPTILVLPINKVAASFHLFNLSFVVTSAAHRNVLPLGNLSPLQNAADIERVLAFALWAIA
jgi:hypothetical protein